MEVVIAPEAQLAALAADAVERLLRVRQIGRAHV